jgi:crotonobetainyl-CoA:carnitine CoA-transferase CaiB-like acyl-CoA transferase
MTSITPFGQTGLYKGYTGSDLIGWHMGGAGYVTPRYADTTEQEPLRVMQMASFITAITAAVATMCALHVQRHTGLGQQVDVSQLEALVLSIAHVIPYWPYEHRSETRVSKARGAPNHFLQCKDGWVLIHAVEPHHWRRFVDMMGNPEWANEELFKDHLSRGEYWESLESLITDWTIKHTKAEIFEAARMKGTPVTPANSVAEVMESRQLKERSFFVDIDRTEVGEFTCPGAPYKFFKTPWTIRKPAPLLGQHNEDLYCNQLGYTKKEVVQMYEAGII